MLFKTACTAERDFLADLISCGCVFLAEVFFLADVFFSLSAQRAKGARLGVGMCNCLMIFLWMFFSCRCIFHANVFFFAKRAKGKGRKGRVWMVWR